jgi:hypothetical protein
VKPILITPASTSGHGEVDTALIRLINAACIPVELDSTSAFGRTLRAEVGWHLDAEVLLRGGDGRSGGGVDVPLDEV